MLFEKVVCDIYIYTHNIFLLNIFTNSFHWITPTEKYGRFLKPESNFMAWDGKFKSKQMFTKAYKIQNCPSLDII